MFRGRAVCVRESACVAIKLGTENIRVSGLFLLVVFKSLILLSGIICDEKRV